MLGDDAVEGHQVGDEVDVGFHGLQHFWLQQHLVQVEPLQGILLHNAHDGAGEVVADIAQPASHVGGGAAQAAAPFLAGFVEGG